MHDNKHNGIYVYRYAKGQIENNDVFKNHVCGVLISSDANPTVPCPNLFGFGFGLCGATANRWGNGPWH